ncbi:hypothetical protein [Cyanobium sp. CH-040]|uniref:hypothetical protein n=1 Tax=Cyanobium sp. CH-040 TaxID=2823708 RepID=UPI0020CCB5D3|nr:hypothetical protein [Cyanobium sp. CH-040]MCP9927980.1 hypothetical protein [Cyanobium sp. CH-040]
MTRRDSLVTGAVLVICAAILVLFTNVEDPLVRWFSCGGMGSPAGRDSGRCR